MVPLLLRVKHEKWWAVEVVFLKVQMMVLVHERERFLKLTAALCAVPWIVERCFDVVQRQVLTIVCEE